MECALVEKSCVPCRGGVPPLEGEALHALHAQLGEGWAIVAEGRLEKVFTFKDFRGALAFTNAVGGLAEAENHHPDLYLAWGKVRVTLWTHKVNGLTENDSILAAKIDTLSC